MNLKRLGVVTLLAASVGIFLAGCGEEKSESTMDNSTTAQIGKSDSITLNDKSQREQFKSLDTVHEVSVNGESIKFRTEYGIEKRLFNNWYFTVPSTVKLSIVPVGNNSRYSYQLSNLYSDISIISEYARYNGVRQDSVNTNYSQLKNGGIDIDSSHGFSEPFQAEGINENETSVTVINGYGSSTTDRVTENDLRKHAAGGRLRTVWTVLLTDHKTGKQYGETIQDSIGLPYKHEENDDNQHE